MPLVTRRWDDGTVQVEEEWLNRAKQLQRQYGITTMVVPIGILQREMGLPDHHDMLYTLWVLALTDDDKEDGGEE